MKEVIGKGKTLDQATENALQQLNAERQEVEVEPLETGSKGFLGIGARPARVRVTLRPDDRIRTNVFLRNILGFMGISTTVQIQEEGETITVLLGEEAASLIGHRGQTLDSLQYLIARYLNEDKEEWRKVVVDIDNYRDRREENLKAMAERMAEQVMRNKRDLRTEPLTAPERRIIHMTLKENTAVTTFSVGEGMRKRVVIAAADKSESPRRFNARRGGRGGGPSSERRAGGSRGTGGGRRSGQSEGRSNSNNRRGGRGRRSGGESRRTEPRASSEA
ncbi:MAG TPA: RNA-binding cell elongation regulator Jag/EloR [bacterium]|nr:protein jag [Candidatus Omnitrophota bacterium]HOJ61821.1 RNA-binding cell elongation regulator Jag/EloR [bacterium]HOL95083.1 RNA-binding cell elongation regulator Jag/EloR [bacterium]HPP01743.1 RNA-binding cell elongation regulator Jag/EloR [bacterium]